MHLRRATIALFMLMLAATAAWSGIPRDAVWEGFQAPGLLNTALPIEYQGKLALLGISAVGSTPVDGAALWDGAQVQVLPPLPLNVYAATVWNNRLVVAVSLPNRGPHKIMAWSGGAWDTLGTPSAQVNAMTAWDGKLIAIGFFTSVSGVPAVQVASFDGTAWSAMGTGMQGLGGTPYSIADHTGTLVVGGQMATAKHVVKWDPVGGVWSTLGEGLDRYAYGLVSDGVNLYAAGEFRNSGTTPMSGVARWDGTTWNSIGLPVGIQCSKIKIWNGKIVFNRTTLTSKLMTWDGSTLATLPGDSLAFNGGVFAANAAFLGGMTSWGNKLVLPGTFFRNGTRQAPGIQLFDGSQWSTIGTAWSPAMKSPVGWVVSDLRVWGGKLIAAGEFGLVANGDHYATLPGIAAFDGEHWTGLGEGIGGTFQVLGEYQGDLVTAGWLTFVRNAIPSIRNMARWNGTAWSGFGTGSPEFVSAIQQFHNDLFVLDDAYGLMRWNGSIWSNPYPAFYPAYMDALGATSDSLVIGGRFDVVDGFPSPGVVFWNGTSFLPAGAGVNNYVLTIANWNGRPVIGGDFTLSGSTPMPGAAVWDGSAWQPLGTRGIKLERMRVFNGKLYAVGNFRMPDNSIAHTLARYDDPEWEPMGSGSNGFAFAEYNGYLYETGSGIVNGHLSHNLSRAPLSALLDAPRPEPRVSRVELSASPNPATSRTVLSFALPNAGHARLSVYDASGRLIANLLDADMPAGRHDVRWSTPARPGLYFARLEAPGGERRVTRVVRLD